MRKLKEGDYFAPKNKEEYGFILKSLRQLGYEVYSDSRVDDYDEFPVLLFDGNEFVGGSIDHIDCKNQITLSDLFTEEVEVFEPFQKVLVRGHESDYWELNSYGRYDRNNKQHICNALSWKYCIDYETNKDKHGEK